MNGILEDRLAQVRRRILDRSEATLAEVGTLLSGAATLSEADRERAYVLIHNLAGVTGSVGLADVGEASKALDRLLRPWLRGGEPEPAWRGPLERLDRAFAAARLTDT